MRDSRAGAFHLDMGLQGPFSEVKVPQEPRSDFELVKRLWNVERLDPMAAGTRLRNHSVLGLNVMTGRVPKSFYVSREIKVNSTMQ